jgi:hypothetical protein
MWFHDNPSGGRDAEMRWLLAVLLVFAVCLITAVIGSVAKDTIAQNASEHSRVFIIGYMDDSRVIQTQKGFSGSKMVTGTRGSGTATRTIDSWVYADSTMEETSLTVSGTYDYHPYTPPVVFTQSDLRNALCAKNYEVGSVFSETYSHLKDLIKDTNIYQNDNTSIYDIDSEVQGMARIGARVQKNPHTVPSYIMGGTYIGYVDIRTELQAGNMSIMSLPCP